MCVDLDHFRRINDAYCHYIGDKILQIIAQRLRSALRAIDTASRHDGDKFFLLFEELMNHASAEWMASTLSTAIAQPLHVDALTLTLNASIGIALYPEEGDTAETLINNADMAMTMAKRNFLRYAFFASGLH